jgi:hypothetical protein
MDQGTASVDQPESGNGFTMVDHYWIDYFLPRASGMQVKTVLVALRHTVGYVDLSGPPGARRKEVSFDYDDWKRLTGAQTQAISKALKENRRYGVLQLRKRQDSRQRKFCWRAVPGANLKVVKRPKEQPQEPLPFESDFENQNLNEPCDFENQNLNEPVLRSIKKRNTHKESGRVCGSKFSRAFREQYATKHDLGIGWLNISDGGQRDEDIEAQLRREEAQSERAPGMLERLRREGFS